MKKVCIMCGVEKDISEFHQNRSRSDCNLKRCAPCSRSYMKDYWAKNRERLNDLARKRYYKNNEAINAKKRARYAARGGHAAMIAETASIRPDKEEFALAASDDGISLAAAISLLKMKPHMKVLALAIIGAGSGGADCHYLMETVLKRQCYATLKTAIFWLRRHLVGTGLKLENAGYGRGYRIVFEVAA